MVNSAEMPTDPAFKNAQWSVTKYGLECNDGTYHIGKSRLGEMRPPDRVLHDWPLHMAEKEWVDLAAFMEAFRFALMHHGVPFSADAMKATEVYAIHLRDND